MQEVSKMALKNALKNCETKVAQFNQWANKWAGFKWNGVVLLGAVLLSLLFVGNLQAQSSASTKQGFFAGIVYLQGFGVDTTKTSTSSTTGYEITGYGEETTGIEITEIRLSRSPEVRAGISALMTATCQEGKASVDSKGTDYYFISNNFHSFTEGTKLSNYGNNIFPVPRYNGKDENTSACFNYFFGDLSSDRTTISFSEYEIATPDSLSKSPLPSTESDAINGVGLQVGWRGEKWRASLTHFTGKGGANELVNTVVMAEYFFHEEFFAGGGLASMKLTNGSTSASATSPVLTVGYKENLTPNLFFNISLTKYISGISLSRSTNSAQIPTGRTFSETQSGEGGDSLTIGADICNSPSCTSTTINFQENYVTPTLDHRIQATQVRTRDVEIQEVETPAAQKIEAEIKAPVVVSISLLWRF